MYFPTEIISAGLIDNANSVADNVTVSVGNAPCAVLYSVSIISIFEESFTKPNFVLNVRTSYFTCNEFVTSYLFIVSYGTIVVVAVPFSITNPPLAPYA